MCERARDEHLCMPPRFGFQNHQLIAADEVEVRAPTTASALCIKHSKPFQAICQKDSELICSDCFLDGHTHDGKLQFRPLSSLSQEVEANLKATLAALKANAAAMAKKVKNLQATKAATLDMALLIISSAQDWAICVRYHCCSCLLLVVVCLFVVVVVVVVAVLVVVLYLSRIHACWLLFSSGSADEKGH